MALDERRPQQPRAPHAGLTGNRGDAHHHGRLAVHLDRHGIRGVRPGLVDPVLGALPAGGVGPELVKLLGAQGGRQSPAVVHGGWAHQDGAASILGHPGAARRVVGVLGGQGWTSRRITRHWALGIGREVITRSPSMRSLCRDT